MSSTADIADSAIAVQVMLTKAEKELGAQPPQWYLDLREQVHGLITSAAWAVGETDGGAVIGVRCEGRTHSPECEQYRGAAYGFNISPYGFNISPLVTCPKCGALVHNLFEAGPTPYGCWPCRKEQIA